jgi:hypothetical protein
MNTNLKAWVCKNSAVEISTNTEQYKISFFWYQVLLCSPGWPSTVILLSQPPKCWDYKCDPLFRVPLSFDDNCAIQQTDYRKKTQFPYANKRWERQTGGKVCLCEAWHPCLPQTDHALTALCSPNLLMLFCLPAMLSTDSQPYTDLSKSIFH